MSVGTARLPGDPSPVTSVIILAMIALFLGLRLYSVLGRKTGHGSNLAEPVKEPGREPDLRRLMPVAVTPQRAAVSQTPVDDGAQAGLTAIAAADRSFDLDRFMEGASAAYQMVLDAFWAGDRETLAELTGEDVQASFDEAIAAREAAGERLDNRLIAIEEARVSAASLYAREARITVKFEAAIAAVTRNGADEIIAGATDDAVTTHDLWTFERSLSASDPNWLLTETDEAR